MTLQKFIEERVSLCTHVMIVRNGKEPIVEAVTHISPDQVEFMVGVWTTQYYQIQAEAAKATMLKHHAAQARPRRRIAKSVGIAQRAGAL